MNKRIQARNECACYTVSVFLQPVLLRRQSSRFSTQVTVPSKLWGPHWRWPAQRPPCVWEFRSFLAFSTFVFGALGGFSLPSLMLGTA